MKKEPFGRIPPHLNIIFFFLFWHSFVTLWCVGYDFDVIAPEHQGPVVQSDAFYNFLSANFWQSSIEIGWIWTKNVQDLSLHFNFIFSRFVIKCKLFMKYYCLQSEILLRTFPYLHNNTTRLLISKKSVNNIVCESNIHSVLCKTNFQYVKLISSRFLITVNFTWFTENR